MEMSTKITIILNGHPHETGDGGTVESLLRDLGMDGKPLVVELDEVAVFPRDYAHTAVPAGARVEMVVLAAGG